MHINNVADVEIYFSDEPFISSAVVPEFSQSIYALNHLFYESWDGDYVSINF